MKNGIYYLTLIALAVWSSAALAQDEASPAPTSKKPQSEIDEDEITPVVEMPTVGFSNGKQFWYRNRFNITESLSDASIHYRKGELRAAKGEIEEAITWLQIVKINADQASKIEIEIETVITDLTEVAAQLNGEKSVSADKLNRAFANANLALARHHFSKANKLTEQSDLMNASRRLVAAADHMKNAAYSADVAPSGIVGTFRDEYSPYGMVNETLELTPEQLYGDLEKLSLALKNLGSKMQDKAVE